MKNITYVFLITVIFIFTACEEQPIIIEQSTPQTDRKILIEEFTGSNCAACPRGAEQIETLRAEFGEKIIAVAIHSTVSSVLGDPLPGAKYDLRTTTGDDLIELYGGFIGIPAAVFNRTKFEGETHMMLLSPDTWPFFVNQELNKEPIVELTTDLTFDADSRNLTIDIVALPLVDKNADFRVGAMIVESHIIDKQNKDGETVDDYENNHILRQYISNIEGDLLTSSFVTNTPINKQYTFPLPQEENGLWVAHNCSVITFVSEVNEDEGTIKVLQADEAHLPN